MDVTPADQDMCWLTALIPAAQAMAIDARLDQIAATVAGADERSREEIRADAVVDLLLVPGGMRRVSGEPTPKTGAPAVRPVSPDAGAASTQWFDDLSTVLGEVSGDADTAVDSDGPPTAARPVAAMWRSAPMYPRRPPPVGRRRGWPACGPMSC